MKKHAATENKIQDMVNWIVDYMLENGYPPCRSEIELEFQISATTANAWTKEARALKLLDYNQKPRSYQVPGVYYVDARNGDYVSGFKIGEGA